MTEAVAVSGLVRGVQPGYEMQPGGGDAKLEKGNFISSNKTRDGLELKHPIEWIDSGTQLGLPDDAGSSALERSIFVVCDIEVLTPAGFRYQAVRNYQIS